MTHAFQDFTTSQEFTDGVRGDNAFTTPDAMWAAIYDTCRFLGTSFFGITTYNHLALGCFSEGYQTGSVSPPMKILTPALMFWMCSSMGRSQGTWVVDPEERIDVHFTDQGAQLGARVDKIKADPAVRALVEEGGTTATPFLATRQAQIAHVIDQRSISEHRLAPSRSNEGVAHWDFVKNLKWVPPPIDGVRPRHEPVNMVPAPGKRKHKDEAVEEAPPRPRQRLRKSDPSPRLTIEELRHTLSAYTPAATSSTLDHRFSSVDPQIDDNTTSSYPPNLRRGGRRSK